MENQSETNKKTWQEPEINNLNIMSGILHSTNETTPGTPNS